MQHISYGNVSGTFNDDWLGNMTNIGQRRFREHRSQDVAVERMRNTSIAQNLGEGGGSLQETRDFVHDRVVVVEVGDG